MFWSNLQDLHLLNDFYGRICGSNPHYNLVLLFLLQVSKNFLENCFLGNFVLCDQQNFAKNISTKCLNGKP